MPGKRLWAPEPLLTGQAVEIVGNARALLQMRRQIDRALKGEDGPRPLDDALYRDNLEEQYGVVVVRRAKSREEMELQRPPKPERAPE